MPNFKEAELEKLIIHKVGNKADHEPLKCSKNHMRLDEDLNLLLKKFFLRPFKEEKYYNFVHSTDLNLNEVYHYAGKFFEDKSTFLEQSVNIATQLYQASDHPKIKAGELYVVYFDQIQMDEERYAEGLGIFKSENKDTYIKVYDQNTDIEVERAEGINIKKLDKGCIIINEEKEKGYRVLSVDNTNKGNDAQYWLDNFLGIAPTENSHYHTENYIELCKSFVEETFDNASKMDKIELVDNSIQYFNENKTFNVQEFEEQVMQEPEIIDSFGSYRKNYEEEKQVPTYQEFEIDEEVAKKKRKYYKSIIKLDKNFHVYVHGKRDYIERGHDPNLNLNYYKLYFNEEE